MLQRLIAIIRKELIGMLRDRRARMSLIIPPVIQLLIFAQAATMEVKNIELGIVDLDRGDIDSHIEFVVSNARTAFRPVYRVDNGLGSPIA